MPYDPEAIDSRGTPVEEPASLGDLAVHAIDILNSRASKDAGLLPYVGNLADYLDHDMPWAEGDQ